MATILSTENETLRYVFFWWTEIPKSQMKLNPNAICTSFEIQWTMVAESFIHFTNVLFLLCFHPHTQTNTHANSRTYILHGHPQKLSSYYLLFAAFSIKFSVFGCYFLVSKFWIICQPQNGNEFFFTVGMRKMGGLSIKLISMLCDKQKKKPA